jgi:4'-phosphopantetheinyl transferase
MVGNAKTRRTCPHSLVPPQGRPAQVRRVSCTRPTCTVTGDRTARDEAQICSAVPSVWGAHGKPRVEAAPQLHVSISHAADRVAVAVTALGPVGVDLEPAGAGDFDGLADVALTPRERLALRRLPSEQRSSAALTWWVRKEAVLKATGDGMFVAPADIEVSGPAEEPRLIAWSAGGERKVPTRLVDLQLGPDYVGCVGVLSHRTPLARLIEGDELLAAAAVPLRTTTG